MNLYCSSLSHIIKVHLTSTMNDFVVMFLRVFILWAFSVQRTVAACCLAVWAQFIFDWTATVDYLCRSASLLSVHYTRGFHCTLAALGASFWTGIQTHSDDLCRVILCVHQYPDLRSCASSICTRVEHDAHFGISTTDLWFIFTAVTHICTSDILKY